MADQVVTQTTAPWTPMQPYLESGFQRAENLYQQGPLSYGQPGQSYVQGFGGDTQNALGMFRNQAMAGSPTNQAATQQATDTLQGEYLTGNPYLDATYDQAARAVTRNYSEAVAPSIAANFGMSGRTGSNMAFANSMDSSRDNLQRGLGELATNIYGGNYQAERGRQMQALGMAPSIAPLNYYDAGQLLNVGQTQDQLGQRQLDEQFNRYQYNQEAPWDLLGRYQGALGGKLGTETRQPEGDNTIGNILTGIGIFDGLNKLFGP